MSTLKSFCDLYQEITGFPPDNRTINSFQYLFDLAGQIDRDLPSYLCNIIKTLAEKKPLQLTNVPEDERGFSWLLDDLSQILPESEFCAEPQKNVLILRNLGLTVSVTRNGGERYTIEPWSEKPDSSNNPEEPIVLNEFDPTSEQIREWAYSLNIQLTQQDEVLAFCQPVFFPLLIELVDDTNCPKRDYILSAVHSYVASARGGVYDRKLLKELQAQAAQAKTLDLRAWGKDLEYVLNYIDGEGPVSLEDARRFSEIAMLSRNPDLYLREEGVGSWWRFVTRSKSFNFESASLYICQFSGAVLHSKKVLEIEDLSPHENPEKRDDPLSLKL
jgi:hypothetical protein